MIEILEKRRQAAGTRRPPAEPATNDRGVPELGSDIEALPQRLITKALTIRRVEERLLILFAEGQLSGTVHTCIGQEWIAVAVAECLQRGDYIFSNHRGHGHYLAWSDDLDGFFAELMGRVTGVCGGRGGSQHLCKDGFFSNGIQGGIVPVSAGLAMAQKLEAEDGIAVVFIGDGTLGQGVVYETMNLAAKWSLPLVIVVEDNGIAQSTASTETLAGSIKNRARAFGIDYSQADTWDVPHLLETADTVMRNVREDRRPMVLHVKTDRLKAHSKGDDDRDQEQIAAFVRRDVLGRILAKNDPQTTKTLDAIDGRIQRAVFRASEAASTTVEQSAPQTQYIQSPEWQPVQFASRKVVEAIRGALAEILDRDERAILLGEDLCDPYGGAFKVTSGLSRRFGDRVYNTPISEAALVGLGNGLALAGYHPIVEIMFNDFLMLAADQFINHAAKFAWMFNEQVRVPLVIRTPAGGYRGYGPTHSQCLEKHLLGLPGTRVLALHHRWCPGRLYHDLLADIDRPTLVIENKTLYGRQVDSVSPQGYSLSATTAMFPTVRFAPEADHQLTIVAYGGMASLVEAAAKVLWETEELACDVLMPTQLYPLDYAPMIESVRRTGRLLVVEEGQGFAGFGSELIAALTCDPRTGTFQANRLCAAEHPIPAAKTAEGQALPDNDQIVQAAKRLVLGRISG
ncbi:MAG: pyruvate dehydrogenase [Phycisphaerales bacterium]|nr:pyruvate dehydrogenase [Phycisphaerales bacterium]